MAIPGILRPTLAGALAILVGATLMSAGAASSPLTHPLMPGIRSAELRNPDWPRVMHDKQITGFSPLVCDMAAPPRVWSTIDVGGELNWVTSVAAGDETMILVDDGRLRLVDLEGDVRWSRPSAGWMVYWGDLRGNGRDYLLLSGGRQLVLVDGASGETVWSHRFEPDHVQIRIAVGDVLPEQTGMEAVVFLAYGLDGALIHFPPEGDPEFIWERQVVTAEEWPYRADHGVAIHLDTSDPDEVMVWNIRHHRCYGYDARTGERRSTLVYDIGDGQRRNYGPSYITTGPDGALHASVYGEQVQTHVHSIRLEREGPSELAWQRYYGEVYVLPGVAVQNLATADMDGDGGTEMVYSARDPEQDFRSFVRVRDVATGAIEAELSDHWAVSAFFGLGADRVNGLLAIAAPGGAMPETGEIEVYRCAPTGELQKLGRIPDARIWAFATLPGPEGNELLLQQTGDDGAQNLVRFTLEEDELREVGRAAAPALMQARPHLALDRPDGERLFLVAGARGLLEAVTWEGERRWELDLSGGAPATMSAADWDGDGRAELAVLSVGDTVRAFSIADDGSSTEDFSAQFVGDRYRLGPLFYDLGDGQLCLITPGRVGTNLAVRAWKADGSLLWESVLEARTDGQNSFLAWNAGDFLPGNDGHARSAVAVSTRDGRRTVEATYLLDGTTGEVKWHRNVHEEGNTVRGFVPAGLPGAFDVDGDGVEEINMDMLSYLALIRGADASFAYIRHSGNISPENALYACQLYNSCSPVYRNPGDVRPHWFSSLGHGIVGMMDPEPSTGVWREEADYDTPEKIGIVDVDGDGAIEAGYALRNSNVFKCRDLFTGTIEWELELPQAPNGPVITADVDGDGKGEFLVGPYCIGTDADGRGELRWQAPFHLGWAVIADFDGDGVGEIACATSGRIQILKGGE